MDETMQSPMALKKDLLSWYDKHRRELPWRTQPNLYKTVVSEYMLQQTQVTTVLPYFDRWMKRFPDFETLAKSDEAEVVRHWEGLGYYRRARYLHATARQWIAQHPKPRSFTDWIAFPGVGNYMAAAISSIAFEDPSVVVDGNVIRVISRLRALTTSYSGNSAAIRDVEPIAQLLQNAISERHGDFNQALMELGAIVCRKGEPDCLLCPWQHACLARKAGLQHSLPKLNRKATKSVIIPRLLVVDATAKSVLLSRNHMNGRLKDMYELPIAIEPATANLEQVATIRRGISNERITEPVYRCSKNEYIAWVHKKTEPEWILFENLSSVSLSGPHRKWLSGFLASDGGSC
jgi:A/G-specific adenine glycosylase